MRTIQRMLKQTLAAALLFGMMPSLWCQAEVIDDFNNTTFPGASLTAPGITPFSEAGVAGVAGGTRNITLSATAATGPANNVAFSIGGGSAFYASGAMANGSLSLSYDGATLAADLGGPLASIIVGFLSFDDGFNQGMDVAVTVSDGANNADLIQSIVGSSLNPFSLIFDLSLFNNIGAVDLANLTSIGVLFGAKQGQDFALSGIGATVVPEPASILIWGVIALVAGGGFGLRRMRAKR